MDEVQLYEKCVKLYQRKKNGWFIVGYKCPKCYKHYHTLRKEFYTHMDNCAGKKTEDT